jgi:putative ABC transport system permease protein
MNYALTTLWHDRSRYLPGMLAVAFSAVLIALQCGLLLGLFSVTSIPIDHTRADIWVGSKDVLSIDLGRPIPLDWISRITAEGDVYIPETFYEQFASWTKPDGGSELCVLIGSKLGMDDISTLDQIPADLRLKLTQPDSVVISIDDFKRLGVTKVGEYAKINMQRVQVVGTVKGLRSLAGAYVFCSSSTAQHLLYPVMPNNHCTYYLVRCKNPADAPGIVQRLQNKYHSDMSAFTSQDFSLASRKHWLFRTKAGIAIGYAAILGLIVGMVVTSQTLYAATTASAREYAILLALGIPRWRISWTVLTQSFWIGLFGLSTAVPFVYGLAELALLGKVDVLLPWQLLVGAGGVTMLMALVSGLFALRSVRQIEPMTLLR